MAADLDPCHGLPSIAIVGSGHLPISPVCKMAPKSAGKNGKVAPSNEKKEGEGVSNGTAAPPGSQQSEKRSFFHKYIFPGPLHNFKCRFMLFFVPFCTIYVPCNVYHF